MPHFDRDLKRQRSSKGLFAFGSSLICVNDDGHARCDVVFCSNVERENAMSGSERTLIVFFRLAMGWTFLYAASHQIFDPNWSIVGFLSNTKTFHDVFAVFVTPTVAPIVTF